MQIVEPHPEITESETLEVEGKEVWFWEALKFVTVLGILIQKVWVGIQGTVWRSTIIQ